MPHSYKNCLEEVKKHIKCNVSADDTIIDIGTGSGSWCDILRAEGYKNIDGIEIADKYFDEYDLKGKYNNIICADARTHDFNKKYDLAIIGDMLEHIDVYDAKALLVKLQKVCKNIVVIVPYLLPQNCADINEVHVQPDLTYDVFKERYNDFICISEKENLGVTQGVWIWKDMDVGYTVVIPEHNEKQNLAETIANIKATQKNCVHIEHVNDTERMGTSYSRHVGITRVKTEVIITIDAHMRFMPGALDKMAQHIADSTQDTLCCLRCHYNDSFDFDKPSYTGAKLLWKQDEKENRKAISAVWDSNDVGEIPAVMGGCYGFKKSSYLKMGEPWKLGFGWGGDEETLSVAMRLIGGVVELLPYRCAHLYIPRKEIDTTSENAGVSKVWYNKVRNLFYFPISNEQRNDLLEFTLSCDEIKDNRHLVTNLIDERLNEINKCKDILIKNQKIHFDDYASKWISGFKSTKEVKIKPQPVPHRILKHECMNCTVKHLSIVSELLKRKDDMVMILGHLACAYNHSGIRAIDKLINDYRVIEPKDIAPILERIDLEQEFEISVRSEKDTTQQCIEYLAIASVIAMEIATGYNNIEYHTALLGNLSIAQDLAVLKNAELANRIRGMRLWLYPDGVRIAKFREIDVALIKDMARLNYSVEPQQHLKGKPCRGCGKKNLVT